MQKFLYLFFSLLCLIGAPVSVPAVIAQNATSVLEVVKAGKSATVLVDTANGEGSAYCVSEAGVFATDAHVVSGFKRVRLVLYPGEPGQAILTARVSHRDEDNDMALLVLDPPLKKQIPHGELKALPLGKENELFETMSIAVFGFPLGKLLAIDDRELPSITVTTGHITALRRQNGVLKEIQVDAAVNPGNSGGPVVNTKGEVVGMIQTQIEGAAGLNFAIPVTMVRKLMAMPELIFEPGAIDWTRRLQLQSFELRLLPAPLALNSKPGAKAANYTIEFQVGNGITWRDASIFPMVPAMGLAPGENLYRVSATFQEQDYNGKLQFKVVVKQDGKTLLTTTGNLPINRGSVPFDGAIGPPPNHSPRPHFEPGQRGTYESEFVLNPDNKHFYQFVSAGWEIGWEEAKTIAAQRRHEGLSGHLATLTSPGEQAIARQFAARVEGLGMNIWLGGYQEEDAAEPDGGWKWITGEPWTFTSWAEGEPNNAGDEKRLQITSTGGWNDGQDVSVISFLVEYEPPLPPVPVAVPGEPLIENGKTTINLQERATDVTVGGGGRFLIFLLKKLHKLAVYDVKAGKIAHLIGAPAENVQIAAGRDKLVVLLNDQGLIQRWDLLTGQREATQKLDDETPVDTIALGYASNGPLIVSRRSALEFFDLQTLKSLQIKVPLLDAPNFPAPVDPVYSANIAPPAKSSPILPQASGDGRLFTAARADRRGGWIFHFDQNTLRATGFSGGILANTIYEPPRAFPGYDGRWIYVRSSVFGDNGKATASDHLKNMTLIPAVQGAYFAGISNNWDDIRERGRSVQIFSANDRRSLGSLGLFEDLRDPRPSYPRGDDQGILPLARRLYLIPQYEAIVSLNANQNQIIVRRLDLKKILEGDYLFVSSMPPLTVGKGKVFAYQVETQSKRGGVSYKIESGPTGMEVSLAGLVKWLPLKDFAEGEANVVLAIRDAGGQEIFHSFRVKVE